jgi:hypothetical protein
MATSIAEEIDSLRDQLEGLQTSISRNMTKDVSLVAGLKEWSGDSKGKTVQEYFAQIETFAKVSHWTEQDMALIAKAKLQGLALQFLNGKEELLKDSCPYGLIKKALVDRFTDKLPDQYHYTQLQDAVQGKNESAEVFGDRCRKLCQKTVRKVDNEVTQIILNEEAERRLVAAYINGLKGIVGQQVKFRMPASMDEAVRLAITIENAEQQRTPERRVFTAAHTEITCYQCNQKGHMARHCRARPSSNSNRNSFKPRFTNDHGAIGRGHGRPAPRHWQRGSPPPPGGKCTYCHANWHFRQNCPKLTFNKPGFRKEQNQPGNTADPNLGGPATRPPLPGHTNGGPSNRRQ